MAKEKSKPKHYPKAIFKVENIVASANLQVELDLYAIAQNVRNVEYEPEQFPGAILKLVEPKSSLLLFKNGKIICTGAKSEADVKRALEQAIKILADYSHAPSAKK
ncbi:TATA-box-binding protein [Candidatus Gugararchaeum adminiculabundum]|nr:TATA-box-binding protein [Candidatus Gugararchaeum adminiculabundum]